MPGSCQGQAPHSAQCHEQSAPCRSSIVPAAQASAAWQCSHIPMLIRQLCDQSPGPHPPGGPGCPGTGTHTQPGTRLGLCEHHTGSSSHQVPQHSGSHSCCRNGLVLWREPYPSAGTSTGFFPSLPVSGASSGAELGSTQQGGRRAQAGAWDAEPSTGVQTRMLAPQLRDVRAAPLPLWWARSGRGLLGPPSSRMTLQRPCSISHLCPEHPRAGL